jgi:FkbM family methyltransferase
LASLYDRQLDYFGIDYSKSETVKLSTLDDYCEKNSIDRIDFLKMDVEGHELKVLKGAERRSEAEDAGEDFRTQFKQSWLCSLLL